jgi:CRP-like cAMP-binding protein
MVEESKAIKYLQKLSLFQSVPLEMLAELAASMRERTLDKDEILLQQGEPGEAVFLIRSGWLQIAVTNEENERNVLGQCGPREVIGEMSLIDPQPCPLSVIALSRVQLYELQRADLLAAVQARPLLGLELARSMSAQLQSLTAYLEKASEWSLAVGEGEFDRVLAELEQAQAGSLSLPDHSSVAVEELLTAVVEMTGKVKQREESLKPKITPTSTSFNFNIEIDEQRRQAEVEKLAQRTFFGRLKTASQQIRQRRGDG